MQHGWVAVDNGTTLYRTSDGGAHWAKITPAIAASITAVAQLNFVSTGVGWALGYTPEAANEMERSVTRCVRSLSGPTM
jgi:photosystem II stability/assembly factor-like uncharacterized protein